MAAKTLHDIARAGFNVLAFAIDSVTGLVTAQLGDVVSQKAVTDEDEWYYPPGIISLPQAPVAGKTAAEVAVIQRSGHSAIVGCRDARDAALITSVGLTWGEALVFSPKGGGYVVFRADKSVQMFNGGGASWVKLNADGTIVAGDAGADFVAIASKVASQLTLIATSLNQCATYINGIVPGTVTPYTPGSTSASKLKGT